MINSIGILIGGANQLSLYFKKIIKGFQARVFDNSGIFESFDCMDSSLKTITKPIYEQASLVVTPNGYKEDKLYAIKPDDGSGDLVVTRATTATRVNSDGLIEFTPYNLLQRSQEFDNAVWAISGTITKTANSVNAPNGSLTADTILGANSSSYISQSYTGTNGVVYTNSFFIKNNNSTQSLLVIRNSVSTISANINWSGSVLTSITNGLGVTTFEDYGDGWYRIISTYTALEDAQRARIYPTTSTNQSVYLWGAQLVTGTSAKEYFPTTDRLDVPRLDYTNSSCPSILVEPQRTNVFTYSEQFDNAIWTKTRSTVTANATTAPDGTLTADFLTQQTGETSAGNINQSFTNTIGVTYTFSVFAKKNTKNFIGLRSNSVGAGISYFDLLNGTLGTVGASHTAKIESYDDDWYRCSITYTATVVSLLNLIYIADSSSTIVTDSGGVYLWGAQLEAGSYATSYVPTIASSVTRNADLISKTGISSLIGQTEGTMFVEGSFAALSAAIKRMFSLSNGSTNNDILIQNSANSTDVQFVVVNGGTIQVSITVSSAITFGTNFKAAFVYSENYFAAFINGVKVGQDLLGTVPACSKVAFARGNDTTLHEGTVKVAAIWKTKLTDQECINLTTI